MRVRFSILISVLLLALVSRPQPADAVSIGDLPRLSEMTTHHFDCRLLVTPLSGRFREMHFTLQPGFGGHQALEKTLTVENDSVLASVNQQMLMIEWKRSGQLVAAAQTMIQNSPTLAYVLIVIDPQNVERQTHLNCNAVTFADRRRSGAQP